MPSSLKCFNVQSNTYTALVIVSNSFGPSKQCTNWDFSLNLYIDLMGIEVEKNHERNLITTKNN